MKKSNWTEKAGFKLFLHVLYTLSGVIAVSLFLGLFVLSELGLYEKDFITFEQAVFRSAAEETLRHICYTDTYYDDVDKTMRQVVLNCQNINKASGFGFQVEKFSYGTGKQESWEKDVFDTPYVYEWDFKRYYPTNKSISVNGEETVTFKVTMYANPDTGAAPYHMLSRVTVFAYDWKYALWVAVILAGLESILCFVQLMRLAGHRFGREGITPGVLTKIPLDLLVVFFGAAALSVVALVVGAFDVLASDVVSVTVLLFGLAVELVGMAIFCEEFILRLKLGKWWKNTLVFRLSSGCLKLLGKGGHLCRDAFLTVINHLPNIFLIIILILAFTIFEAFYQRFPWSSRMVFWAGEKLVQLIIFLYCAVMFDRLQEGSKNLAEGNLTHKIDTSKMILGLRVQGEHLNHIGEGISRAVEQRMRSERMKTELITNVSHDLKTPLTSIINYADLLGTEVGKADDKIEKERLAECSDVLLRQSKRLKKLLDDLLEVSKATTGNLEVTLSPCGLSVFLIQASGEYEAKFAERQLDFRVNKPEEDIIISADGKYLWRVFDNLLNNIYKYAQENTRVYLDVLPKGENVQIIFRNISKYELNLSAEELEERFVRGDQSRHMEGNGLGLSIAGSLTELQGGHMEIVTDGDLFKVVLEFPRRS